MSSGTGLLLTSPRSLEFVELESRPLDAGEVRLRSLISGISHGTELNLYRGTAPFASKTFDPHHRSFVPAEPGERLWPVRLGYDLVGEVTEVGPGVDAVGVGDRLHVGQPHQSESIIRFDRAEGYPPSRLPRHDHERGLFISLGSVALQAIHDARIKVGDDVVVTGAGVIGLLCVQLARLAGAARVVVAEPLAERRAVAEELGATATIDPTESEAPGHVIKKLLRTAGADVTIETSGSDAGLHLAIAAAGVGATVVAAGFYQGGAARLRLGEEWHHNRLNLVSSMGVWDCPHRDHPLWHRPRMMDTVTDLIYSDRLRVDRLLTETIPFERAAEAYQRLDRDPASALKIALSYS
jgi:threonine dehydrogenase-like Zn-dependent dehydrogenase